MPQLHPHPFATAQQYYQSGQLAEAATLYRQALEQEPESIEALTWLARITEQMGQLDESVAYYQQILTLQPDEAEVHSNLGAVLCRQGHMAAAIAHQQQALALKPDADTHYNLGVVLYHNGQIEAAMAHYRQAIALVPTHSNAHSNLAMVLCKQNELEAAIAHYEEALRHNPNHVNAHNGLGVALFYQGQVEPAIAHYQRAIALQPNSFSAYNNLGTALQRQGKLDEAAAMYRQALALKPDYASAYDNLGTIFQEQGKLDEAIDHYRRAIELDPTLANAYNNLGSALKTQGDVAGAIAHCREAIRLQPNHADAHNNYASSLVEQAEFERAIEHYQQALHYKPDHANAHLNLGIVLLLLGDLTRGFREYHWRWQSKQCPDLRYPEALWDGSDLNGKVILLTAEQGYGDTIQFARYAPLVAQRGGHVVIACQKTLLRLLNTLPGIDRCVDRDHVDVQTHVHAPLLDLPLLLGTTLDTIPGEVPYLMPPSDFRLPSCDRPFVGTDLIVPSAATRPLKIGIVWATNPDSSTSSKRSCALEYFLALAHVPGVVLYSLQKQANAEDQARLAAVSDVIDLSAHLHDFADTAAAIAQLDLIISVDTAVAHLAGALGKLVWNLLAAVADWRWLRDREDSPWYPTMRLFRQTQEGCWDDVFERVTQALRSTVEQWSPQDQPIPSSPPVNPISEPEPPLPVAPTAAMLLPEEGFNRLQKCRHGTFLYNRNDLYIGRSLELYGEWSEGEVSLFQSLLRLGDVVIEVGANIGTHTVFLAKAVGPQGHVFAIEPQRIVFQTLCANLALNSITNTHCYAIGLGDAAGFAQIPVLDYHQLNNFGGVSLQQTSNGETVQIATLDSFAVPHCRLLKIDVEGMELSVLKGAISTIQRCQPIVYIENDRQENSSALIAQLQSLGYALYWHCPPLYNPVNYCQNPQNVFGNTISVNLLGVLPSHGIVIQGLEPVAAAPDPI